MFEFGQFLGAILLSAIIVAATGWVSLQPWRRSLGAHWTERARILWPARMDVRNASMACGIMAVVWSWSGTYEAREAWVPLVAGVILGATLGTFPFERAIEPGHRFRSWLHSQMWGLFAFFASTGILLSLMIFLPYHMTASDWWIAGLGLLVVIVVKTGLLLPLLARLSKHAPVDERLCAVVRRCEERVGISPRRVWVAASPTASAMAMPVTKEVLVTSRLLEILSDAELETVMRHEFAHLTESRPVVLGRIIRALAWLPLAFLHPAVGWLGMPGMLLVLVVPVLLNRWGLDLARRMEHRADRAVVDSADDPAVYASALEKIYEINQIPAVLPGDKAVHPHLYDRMVSAGAVPSYPRPLPPTKHSGVGLAVLAIPVIMIAVRVAWAVTD